MTRDSYGCDAGRRSAKVCAKRRTQEATISIDDGPTIAAPAIAAWAL